MCSLCVLDEGVVFGSVIRWLEGKVMVWFILIVFGVFEVVWVVWFGL